jgi:hypothetical protein
MASLIDSLTLLSFLPFLPLLDLLGPKYERRSTCLHTGPYSMRDNHSPYSSLNKLPLMPCAPKQTSCTVPYYLRVKGLCHTNGMNRDNEVAPILSQSIVI